MSRPVLVGLLVLLALLLAGLLYWMSLGGGSAPTMSAPASNAVGATQGGGAIPATSSPTGAKPDEPASEPENSFIICPGNPRCP